MSGELEEDIRVMVGSLAEVYRIRGLKFNGGKRKVMERRDWSVRFSMSRN